MHLASPRRANPWAYHVSDKQRRLGVAQNEQVIAQIDARIAAGLAPFVDAYIACYGDEPCEPWNLITVSAEACAALGVTGDDLVDLAAYLDYENAAWPWLVGKERKGWYQAGERIAKEIEARFGERISAPAAWPKLRADAVRRLRTARNALRGA